MRLNKFIALATGHSRRSADTLIAAGKVSVNGAPASLGQRIIADDIVTLNGQLLHQAKAITIMLHKPVGYVCSRDGQGNPTVYDLLPPAYQQLKPIGRLDKNSSGLLLLTNDGDRAHQLTHPSFKKEKVYIIELNKALTSNDRQQIESGVRLEDGPSALKLKGSGTTWQVTMSEGRNRQIRRTFAALGYNIRHLHRIQLGNFVLGELPEGKFERVELK